MAKELFGTDGIRGVAGEYPLDPATIFAFGAALGREALGTGEILVGADTRESSPWIAELVAGGLEPGGARVRYAGVITTPGIAYLTRTGPFVAGVMISASHNPYQDNGIKVFTHSGFKLPDAEEHAIEQEIFRLRELGVAPAPATLAVDEGLDRQYLEYLVSTSSVRFDGVTLAMDCGNGAASLLGPCLFRRLGADVTALFCAPDGRNINLDCGALHVERLAGRGAGASRRFRRGLRWRRRSRHLRRRERQDRGWRRRAAGRGARDEGRRTSSGRHGGVHRDVQPRPGAGPGARRAFA